MKTKTKTFDCVEMKREADRKIYERIKDMTPQEELAYWRKGEALLDKRIKDAKRKAAQARSRSTKP